MASLAAEGSTSRPRSSDISSLSPEILLSIFLKLDSEEIIIFRRTCKKWLDVIDTNKLLWRNLEWIGKSGKSLDKAVEVFDEKSASTLEKVQIEEVNEGSKDFQQLVVVIGRSKETLKSISVSSFVPDFIMCQLLHLARTSRSVEKLVLWHADAGYKSLPLVRLVPDRKRVDGGPSTSSLKILWLYLSSKEEIKQVLQLPTQFATSLISFALSRWSDFQEIRPLLASFAETIVHLSLSIVNSESQMEQPIFCPNLKILEGSFQSALSIYFNCGNLKHIILPFGSETRWHGIPSSVEQLWLKSGGEENWKPLLRLCPKMEVLRLRTANYMTGRSLQSEALIQVLEKRQEMVKKGDQIQGLLVVPLQTLVLPLTLFSEGQIERARKAVGEVADVKDYPEFIELQY